MYYIIISSLIQCFAEQSYLFSSLFSLIFSPETTIWEKREERKEKSEKWREQKETTIFCRKLSFLFGRGSRTWTHDQRFWRPRLYQLSYTPVCFFAFAVFASRIFHGKSDYIITCKINQEFFSFCHGFSLFGRTVRRDTGAIRVQFIHVCHTWHDVDKRLKSW